MHPTLEDVAKLAGVSRATASFTLRDHPKARTFNEATIKRVRLAARELGYRPNFFTSQSRRSAAQLVMVYLRTLQDLYAGSIAESFQQRSAERGYWTLVNVYPPDQRRGVFDERIIGDHGISAVALVGTAADIPSKSELTRLIKSDVRVLTIGRDIDCPGISKVLVDDYHGGWLAANHIYDAGYRRVWLLEHADTITNNSRDARQQGVLAYTEQNGLPLPTIITIPIREAPQEIAEITRDVIAHALSQAASPPEAIIAQLDLRAIGIYEALAAANLQPGRDVAVIGYDDIWAVRLMTPSLTTIRQPVAEMGQTGANILIDMLEGKIRPGRTIILEPELILRDSTKTN